ncbi:MAG: hypothetical protein HYY50_01260 [Candidatus Kerfeldbacteria bacterium]|nr:hypothetical protein [Candidatus Kerfeldbacteria bacterium]
MDSAGSGPELRLEHLRPAELLPVGRFDAETAARLAYQERGSIGLTIHQMFVEADQQPYDWTPHEDDHFSVERFGTDAEAYRAFWENILAQLKGSEAVQHFRQKKGNLDSKQEMAGVFHAFERSVVRALDRVPLNDQQRAKFRAVWSERDFVLPAMAVEMADQYARAKAAGRDYDEDGERADQFVPQHHPFLKFVIGNPRIRPLDYWDSKEARAYLRRYGALEASATARQQLKSDLGSLRDINRQAA